MLAPHMAKWAERTLGPKRLAGITDTICRDAEKILDDPSYSPLNPIRQIAALNAALCNGAAALYTTVNYGDIPSPGNGLPNPPTPSAPKTEAEMRTWSPWAASAKDSQTWQQWLEATRRALADAEKAGTWNPEGNLPVDATWLDKYKWPLVLGLSAGVVGLVLLVRK